MSKTYISNLNSLSTLIDRTIVENIKLNHFRLSGNVDKEDQQKVIVSALQEELVLFFLDTITHGDYKCLTENRTFELKKKAVEFVERISSLCECHSNITYCDGNKLKEVKSENPDMNLVLKLEYKNRENLEFRAVNKNQIDKLYEDILHTTKQNESGLH